LFAQVPLPRLFLKPPRSTAADSTLLPLWLVRPLCSHFGYCPYFILELELLRLTASRQAHGCKPLACKQIQDVIKLTTQKPSDKLAPEILEAEIAGMGAAGCSGEADIMGAGWEPESGISGDGGTRMVGQLLGGPLETGDGESTGSYEQVTPSFGHCMCERE